MRKISLLVVLLAACGRRPGVTITLTHDGLVKVEGKAVTLDELGTLLAARRDAAPLEEVGWGFKFKASSLPVRLEIEDDALWEHVSWVVTILAEQKFWRLSLPGGRAMPLDKTRMGCGLAPDGEALLVRVVVHEDVYALGDRTTRDLEEVGAWIDSTPRDGMLCRIGEIWAQPGVPWRRVRPVFDLLRDRGVRRPGPSGTRIPSRAERELSPLPRPRAEPFRRWPGLFEVDYWSGPEYYEGGMVEPFRGEQGLLQWLDDRRLGLGFRGLVEDDALSRAALLHAKEMSRMGYFGHFSPAPASRSPSERLANVGWPRDRRHSELLAKAETAEAAFQAILKKPENAAVLEDPAFRYAGVAQSGDCWVVLLGADG